MPAIPATLEGVMIQTRHAQRNAASCLRNLHSPPGDRLDRLLRWSARQTPAGSRSQQNSQRLSIGDLGTRFQFRRRATADGMFDLDEGIVRKAHDPRDIFRGYLEGFGAQHRRSLTQLLECDSVVQTAR